MHAEHELVLVRPLGMLHLVVHGSVVLMTQDGTVVIALMLAASAGFAQLFSP